ncbi:hypothetical protein GF367_03425 [Candidatus Woesearchaeota archaeon]|nr:hypothetical protein [Candidatus Woesearchaeota archaeon]
MRRWLLLLLLLSPLAAGENATLVVDGEFSFVDEHNQSYHFLCYYGTEDCCCNETFAEPVVQDDCKNFSIVGVPAVVENGERISYSFTPWKEGDSVTYWIEDSAGEVMKDAYTTTSKSEKRYTPSIEGEERALFIWAEREREGCDDVVASAVVVVQGDAVVCEVPEPEVIVEECSFEESVHSLYVRAKNWQETITLYGRAVPGEYWLFGEETPREVVVDGDIKLNITPVAGENTYGLVSAGGGIPFLVSFELVAPEEEEEEEEEQSLNASYTFPGNDGTVMENETGRNTSLIAGLTGIVGAGLALSWFKSKRLRSRQDSVQV